MTAPEFSIRNATTVDIPAITAIYAHAVLNTVATLDTDEPTIESQTQWFRHHDERHPVLVAEQEGQVVAWASLSDWSTKEGYRTTVEASVYVAPEYHDHGIGTRLLLALIERARAGDVHVIVARISSTNLKSIRLATRCGFSHVGTMREAGFKFGNYVDVELLQFIFGDCGT